MSISEHLGEVADVRSISYRSLDLTGFVFGRWAVISRGPRRRTGAAMWSCVCCCGKVKLVRGNRLKTGKSLSCGCVNATRGAWRNGTQADEYKSWVAARGRCHNPTDQAYANYGGRGITMCPEWRDDYRRFLADMGLRPKGYTLERNDTNGPYSPENCRWATPKEQGRNRRDNVLATFNGETLCAAEWGERLGFAAGVIAQRLARGWAVERALTEPAFWRGRRRQRS